MVTPATPPASPISPTPARNAAIALVAGFVLGLALALFVDHLDDTVRDDDDLARVAPSVPLLAAVPAAKVDGRRPVVIDDPGSPASEAFRNLRTSVQFLGIDRPLKIIEVTSAVPGEGKTTTASNLAVVLARAGKRVCLVDCDLRRARQHVVFGVPAEPGFTSVVLGTSSLDQALVPVTGEERLYLLPAGPPPPNPSELLSSPRVKQVFDALTAEGAFDTVIVDAPPVLPFSDAVVLSGRVDGVLLVLSAGQTKRPHVTKVLHSLGLVAAPVAGLVLNKAKGGNGLGKGYQGYGYSGYDTGYADREPAPPR
nr:CpsD/CapB family tyrosine-protein kinase [Rhabdothermincola salaria]